MKYAFSACTDQGRVRSNNEDAVSIDHQAQVVVLADGMGGYNAGEVASHMATELIRTEMARWLAQTRQPPPSSQMRLVFESCVENANQAIFHAAHTNPQYSGMGTTVVAGVWWEDKLMLAHVGDSRCYRLRAGQLLQLTRDHSWLQEQMDAGLITPQQAAQSGQRNLVTRALGVEELVQVESNEFVVEAQDLYLLCSDGLSEMVSEQDLLNLLSTETTLEAKAQELVDTANAHGGRDNITVALVYADGPTAQRKRSLVSRLLGS
ncbi:MAG: Stp1/IreP family PP2C-type Ser/Thr phosphatase [Giesbergeria sp.]|uniref:Stp1/IreP family PP2C-type Ser/Thr phosphatase n=1 Tax=Giesbergeria sp. TaxID=2818473 RepID=UPI002618F34C|nr:Stp1/IreP family PP2C-type Ser/Thr phosphatase [Giesbergeria sp.]MDD2608188.1 Stp1/IreP family PP2C-type Ser/Thr phosphatase [Giesbergeria sp.]